MQEYKCKICKNYKGNKNGFATHLRLKHDLHFREYELVYIEGKCAPVCAAEGCSNKPNYSKSKKDFNDYCPDHANLARSSWSKKNKDKLFGGNIGWKKGLTKEDHAGIKSQSEKISGENNPWHKLTEDEKQAAIDKARTSRRIDESEYQRRIESSKQELKQLVLTPYKDYTKRGDYVDIECLECNKTFKRTFGNLLQYKGGCPHCNHFYGSSQVERELAEFVKTLDPKIITNTRKIIAPQELDIYSEKYKIAVEFNGLYWHSELYKDKGYHREKTDVCVGNSIRLIHVWEDDWRDKQDIVKSMLRYAFGKVENRIYARKCQIRALTVPQRRRFMASNHLRGDVPSHSAYGLFYNGELTSAISLRKPLQHKDSIEIARFATKLNTSVAGGFTKLLKHAEDVLKSDYDRIITYIDLDHGHFENNVYSNNGFQYVKDTNLDYSYTDGLVREHRLKYKANSGLSELEVASSAGVFRIYGTGNKLYEKPI